MARGRARTQVLNERNRSLETINELRRLVNGMLSVLNSIDRQLTDLATEIESKPRG